MNNSEVLNFMMTYQRITQNMFKIAPKHSSIIIDLNDRHQIKELNLKMYKNIYNLVLLFNFWSINADDLMKALSDAYYKNPELNAERENILVSKEDLKISRSEFLPSITITGSKSEQTTDKLTDRSGNNGYYRCRHRNSENNYRTNFISRTWWKS